MPEPPYGLIAEGLRAGDVVPFFGAAASAVYRPPHEPWEPGKAFMPFGGELAMALGTAASYPMSAAAPGLALVASYLEHVQGNRRGLMRELRRAFAVDCAPGLLHTALAAVEATRFYVTTNYDNLIEKALAARNPHLVIDRGERSRVWVGIEGQPLEPVSIHDLRALLEDAATSQPSRPIVFKMHGSVDLTNAHNDAFLVTEEDYVDFLGRTDGYVPPYINTLMSDKDLLFLGYGLEDWNVRVILRKLCQRPTVGDLRSWAVVRGPEDAKVQIWQSHRLNIYPMDLCEFSEKLARCL